MEGRERERGRERGRERYTAKDWAVKVYSNQPRSSDTKGEGGDIYINRMTTDKLKCPSNLEDTGILPLSLSYSLSLPAPLSLSLTHRNTSKVIIDIHGFSPPLLKDFWLPHSIFMAFWPRKYCQHTTTLTIST